jgi:hypothetical protein
MTALTLRTNGQTTLLTLTAVASSVVTITPVGNVQNNYLAVWNTGNGKAAIEFSNTITVPTPAIASSGSAGSFVLPPNMPTPIVLAVPQDVCYVKAIGDATGSTLLITPVLLA